MRRSATHLVLTALLLGLVPIPTGAQEIAKEELFEKTLKAALQALAFYGRYDNPAEMQRVADIGYRIAQESKFQDYPYTFYLVDMPEPNAFALPGGQIFITRGMLDLGLSDDMLASLLGHEIGHVVLQHGTRMQRKATLLNILSQALLVGVMIGASQGDNRNDVPTDPYGRGNSTGDLIQGTAAAGAVISELLLRSYSREFEDEADDEGQRLAAAAGFDPKGTQQLMEKMLAHMPQSKEYGYWRTHPFFDDRAQAANVRDDLLRIKDPSSAAEYRAKTQRLLLEFAERSKIEPELIPHLKEEALVAWPQGPTADGLRLEKLHTLRDILESQNPLARDWNRLIEAYRSELEQVRQLTPESRLVAQLGEEVDFFDRQRRELYPQAAETLAGGIYETEFLEVFSSNYPDSPEKPAVALALGDAYSRLGRQSEAVERYLEAFAAAPDSQAGERAARGLRGLAPYLNQLTALQQLALESDDSELRELAHQRLATLATEYEELANGATYLKTYPDGDQAAVVRQRLDKLAEALFGEVILYQSVGDHVKGIERIQQILTYAPQSPAAERLRARMVVKS
ncbi:MAG: M48 family metalloprotease [Thermoanaerobaculia bacterium]|jgi:predicted Zn-dependent protease